MDPALSDEQTATWLAYRRMHIRLMTELDRQLARDSGLPQGYFAVLATLAGAPEHRMLLADLARACNFSQSRLSHAAARMEESGWIVREASRSNRRSTWAQLTRLGIELHHEAARGHDQAVRTLMFDPLTDDQARALRQACDAVSEAVAARRT